MREIILSGLRKPAFCCAVLFAAALLGHVNAQHMPVRQPLPHPPLHAPKVETPPLPPSGLSVATLADCSNNNAVKAAFRGDVAKCRDRLVHRGIVVYWSPYRGENCRVAVPTVCPRVTGFRLYDARNGNRRGEAIGENTEAMIVPEGALGDCYHLRAFVSTSESGNSNRRCVTAVADIHAVTVGPSAAEQFQAVGHDNADAAWCTRNSWDKAWGTERWGFVAGTRELPVAPQSGGRDVHVQFGYSAEDHPGTQPAPCAEALVQISRAALTFAVPEIARGRMVGAAFFATFDGDARRCFEYLFEPRRWYYQGAAGASQFIGHALNGRLLSLDHPAKGLAVQGEHVSLDLGSDANFKSSGQISLAFGLFQDPFPDGEITHLTLHSGKYIWKTDNVLCRLNDPHLEVRFLVVETAPEPVLTDPRSQMESRTRPSVPRSQMERRGPAR